MIDREKTIKWLECCGNYDEKLQHVGCTSACPYWENADTCDPVQPFFDALELLKEQEPKTAITNPEKYGDYLKHCPSCETVLPISSQYGRTKFCHLCGQAVK